MNKGRDEKGVRERGRERESHLVLRGSDDAEPPAPAASLIHAERACHSDARFSMCQKILCSGKEREKWKKRERDRERQVQIE